MSDLINKGKPSHPRGLTVQELLAYQSVIDLRYPVVRSPSRGLSYRFMAAEAAWILSGDDRVETIAPYNKKIANFSDDGVTFFGAYGPRIKEQIDQVVTKLAEDLDTRQAVLTIWRQNPPATKDYPCTITIQWLVRDNKIYCIDTMRSSDVWLGWVYDVFNFAMLTYWVRKRLEAVYAIKVDLGTLTLQAGSQHLYEIDHESALRVMEIDNPADLQGEHLHLDGDLATHGLDEKQLVAYLWNLADNKNLETEWLNATLAALP